MKKLIIALLGLALSVGLHAQEISGKWIQTHQESEDGSEMTASETLSIMKGGTFDDVLMLEMKFTDDKNEQAPVKLKVRISCAGTWSLADKVLSQTYDAKSVKTEVLEQPDGFPKFFMNVLCKKIVSEFKKHSKKPVRYNVLALTSDTLRIQETGSKDPETETYTRAE